MKKSFFRGTTPGVRIGFAGFAIGLLGVGLGFLGDHIDKTWLLLLALVVTTVGFLICAFGIIYGWAILGDKQS